MFYPNAKLNDEKDNPQHVLSKTQKSLKEMPTSNKIQLFPINIQILSVSLLIVPFHTEKTKVKTLP